MLDRSSFDYAILRVVPRVERGEQINAGIILYCASRAYLAAEIALDVPRLRALAPDLDLPELERALALYPLIAAGDPRGGPIAALPVGERFHWLTSPRSTITQSSSVHSGICVEPSGVMAGLLDRLVRSTR